MEIIEKISLLDAWILEAKEYKERALLVASKTLLLEQAKRIEQAHGELDGRMNEIEKRLFRTATRVISHCLFLNRTRRKAGSFEYIRS